MKDLLTDNSLAPVTYKGKVPPNNPMGGELTGEAIFLGQTEAYSQPVRYSIGAPFVLSNAQLSRWALDRATLDGMLKTIVELPTTKRVVKGAPAVALNMWYTNASGVVPGGYSIKVEACGDSVPGGSFPTDNKPLEAFGYSLSPSFGQPDFVLVNGKPVVAHLDTYFYVGLDPARAALVPDVFNTGSSRAFQRIWLENNVLKLFMPSDATPAERDIYEKIAKSLPGSVVANDGRLDGQRRDVRAQRGRVAGGCGVWQPVGKAPAANPLVVHAEDRPASMSWRCSMEVVGNPQLDKSLLPVLQWHQADGSYQEVDSVELHKHEGKLRFSGGVQ